MTIERMTLLHIDGDADNRVIVSLALSLADNISVQSFENASAAWNGPCGRPAKLDGLILEYLPRPGAERDAVDALRQQPGGKLAPIIFLTARLMRHEIDAMITSGATGIIAKPFDPLRLAAKVAQMLHG